MLSMVPCRGWYLNCVAGEHAGTGMRPCEMGGMQRQLPHHPRPTARTPPRQCDTYRQSRVTTAGGGVAHKPQARRVVEIHEKEVACWGRGGGVGGWVGSRGGWLHSCKAGLGRDPAVLHPKQSPGSFSKAHGGNVPSAWATRVARSVLRSAPAPTQTPLPMPLESPTCSVSSHHQSHRFFHSNTP